MEFPLAQDLLRAVPLAFAGILLGVFAVAVLAPRRAATKAVLGGLVLVMGTLLMIESFHAVRRERERAEAFAVRVHAAKAHFEARCRSAGEIIHRVVHDVDGVLLLRLRPGPENLSNQFALDDPYGQTAYGEEYIRQFVRGTAIRHARIGERLAPAEVLSYRFVETLDEVPHHYCKHTTTMNKMESEDIARNGGGRMPLERMCSGARESRFGITWKDISTTVDREHWIAGGTTEVVDLASGQVIAVHTGFMMDPGLGDMNGGRTPWTEARRQMTCPRNLSPGLPFIHRVLVPASRA